MRKIWVSGRSRRKLEGEVFVRDAARDFGCLRNLRSRSHGPVVEPKREIRRRLARSLAARNVAVREWAVLDRVAGACVFAMTRTVAVVDLTVQ